MTTQGWNATAEEINALPERVREWIVELETRCDPAEDLRSRRIAEDLAGAYAVILSEARSLLKVARCPDEGCHDGAVPVQVGEDEWEANECQWCAERDAVLGTETAPPLPLVPPPEAPRLGDCPECREGKAHSHPFPLSDLELIPDRDLTPEETEAVLVEWDRIASRAWSSPAPPRIAPEDPSPASDAPISPEKDPPPTGRPLSRLEAYSTILRTDDSPVGEDLQHPEGVGEPPVEPEEGVPLAWRPQDAGSETENEDGGQARGGLTRTTEKEEER